MKTKKKSKKKNNKKNILLSLLNLILFLAVIYYSFLIFRFYFFNEKLVYVPNIVSLNESQAKKILEESHLGYNIISSRSNEVPYDIIYKQFPQANTKVKINRAIKVYINNEKGDKIPNIYGLNLDEARSILDEKKINIKRIDYKASEIEENTVLSTYPKYGDLIKYGESISILVSSRQLKKLNNMPNIIGYDISKAKDIIKKYNIGNIDIIGLYDKNYPENMVIRTDPMPNREIDRNSRLKIYISISKKDKELEESLKKSEKSDESIDNLIKRALENNE
ncbi:PASTA domain-containing protein [Oceanivirga miroungae]|uniref:Protein PASTA domain-containing protein n=1 Tax=Oceanivirga miroungae TaxID=1130046 RepID=A0A6I8MC77_9FUSO|nr:PASTA domain-containing protein [Oceanivirga miroungae]VWL85851.1 protein PASTA domain-containing protein [Oceanivirga miroungae]